MNPLLASPRLDTELVFLEGLLNDDCKCEAAHNYTSYCSGEATYRVTCCRYTFNVCKSSVDNPLNGTLVRMGKNRCAGCLKPAADCWTIRPI